MIKILFISLFYALSGAGIFAMSSASVTMAQETNIEAPKDETEDTELEDETLSDEEQQNEKETAGNNISDIQIPEVSYDLEALPFPTRRMRELILEATKSGDINKLRLIIGNGDAATQLSLGGFDGDPIEFLKEQSGDPDGHEILAILEEILESGYVHVDKGTDQEMYIWPYFFSLPIDSLTEKQRVELFRIVTYGDYVEFKDFGGYIFYRAGISPTGRWEFFVAGD